LLTLNMILIMEHKRQEIDEALSHVLDVDVSDDFMFADMTYPPDFVMFNLDNGGVYGMDCV